MIWLKLFFSLVFTLPLLASASQYHLMISEVMAHNTATLADDAGDYPDWIEIYNSSDEPVDLAGIVLTNYGGFTNRVATNYVFPSYTLDGFAYLIVFFDNATNYPFYEFHTGYGLEKTKGDIITLLAADGIQVDQIGFGIQLTDLSIGRVWNESIWDWEWLLCEPTPGYPNIPKTMGSITNLCLNEWCPTNGITSDHRGDDFIEIYNRDTNPVALAGLVLTTTPPPTPPSDLSISNLSFIDANGFALFWGVGSRSRKPYDANETNVKLSHNTGETLTFYQADRMTQIDQVVFPGLNPSNVWVFTNITCCPLKTNYQFQTQGRLPDGDTNIVMFPNNKSTPGESNFLPLPGIVINEVLAHTDPPLQDAVEFLNATNYPIDISYFWLSNSRKIPKKYRIPPNTIIQPGEFKVFYEWQFNCLTIGALNDVLPYFTYNHVVGDGCFLFSANSNGTMTGYLRSAEFGGSQNGVSFGRYTNSVGNVDFVPLNRPTFGTDVFNTSPTNLYYSNLFVSGLGAPNAYPKIGPVVISEIMYHPPDIILGTNHIDNALDEYIELYNMSTNVFYLYDLNDYPDAYTNRWSLAHAVRYTLPYYQSLAPGQFMLIVNFDPWNPTNASQLAHFRDVYQIPESFTNMCGPYHGKLSNAGDRLELYKFDHRQTDGNYIGVVPQVLVEKIEYNDKLPWPTNADGRGYSLQRLVPESYGNDPSNWVAAIPNPGRHWRSVRFDAVTCDPANNRVVLTLSNAWAGSSYTVQACSNLSNTISTSNWFKVADIPPHNTTGTRTVTDTVPPGTCRFYRLISPMQ